MIKRSLHAFILLFNIILLYLCLDALTADAQLDCKQFEGGNYDCGREVIFSYILLPLCLFTHGRAFLSCKKRTGPYFKYLSRIYLLSWILAIYLLLSMIF